MLFFTPCASLSRPQLDAIFPSAPIGPQLAPILKNWGRLFREMTLIYTIVLADYSERHLSKDG